VLAAVGPRAEVQVVLEDLRDHSEALLWDEGKVPLPAEVLQALGFQRVIRESFLQDLTRLPPGTPDHQGITYARCEGPLVPRAQELFARTHAYTIPGLYNTLPKEPTERGCARSFQAEFSSAALIPSSAIVALEGDRLLGVVYCSARGEGAPPTLMGLAVDPVARGRGLSWGLVRRTQRALLEAGFERMAFFTNDGNLPVHKLFTPEEIISSEVFPIWFGRRDPVTGRWP
jgi:hypothetical protein